MPPPPPSPCNAEGGSTLYWCPSFSSKAVPLKCSIPHFHTNLVKAPDMHCIYLFFITNPKNFAFKGSIIGRHCYSEMQANMPCFVLCLKLTGPGAVLPMRKWSFSQSRVVFDIIHKYQHCRFYSANRDKQTDQNIFNARIIDLKPIVHPNPAQPNMIHPRSFVNGQ